MLKFDGAGKNFLCNWIYECPKGTEQVEVFELHCARVGVFNGTRPLYDVYEDHIVESIPWPNYPEDDPEYKWDGFWVRRESTKDAFTPKVIK